VKHVEHQVHMQTPLTTHLLPALLSRVSAYIHTYIHTYMKHEKTCCHNVLLAASLSFAPPLSVTVSPLQHCINV
jgi:hypothetical protein